jgi:uncharacterized membrane protein
LVLPLFNQPLFNPNSEMFLFQFNQSEINGYEQLRSAISLIPNNASLMTQLNLYPYFANRRYIEVFINSTYYFQPDYILWDGNLTLGMYVNETSNFLYHYLTTNNLRQEYSVAYHEGNTFLLKRNQ